jgi:Zn-dependent M28 family amino/carboxypeptidase
MARWLIGITVALSLAFAHAAGAPEGGMAARLVGLALTNGKAYSLAESLTDGVGARPAGSPGAERAVKWALEQMKALGFKNVHAEPVKVPHWVRGEETAEIVAPSRQRLLVTALGPSVPTPPEGLTAEVVEVASFDELRALGDKARGKIVLFSRTMQRSQRTFEEYGGVAQLRGRGSVEAAKAGAVAALVRSAGTGAYRLPHTGGMRYDESVPKIPAAALAAEDADLIHRLLRNGQKVRVQLKLTPHSEGEIESANVVGDVPGRERPEEIVLLGAHLDSWDLGTGAIDDGAGCAIVLDAARIIGAAGRARRTVRVVLFMNEEMGLSGAQAYAARHAGELGKHVAALEVDSGAGRPLGFGAVGGAPALTLVRKLAAPLAGIRAADVWESEEAGADLIPLDGKVPLVQVGQDLTSYFDWHHTPADTFDKIDPLDLSLDVAAVAVMGWGLAESNEALPVAKSKRSR